MNPNKLKEEKILTGGHVQALILAKKLEAIPPDELTPDQKRVLAGFKADQQAIITVREVAETRINAPLPIPSELKTETAKKSIKKHKVKTNAKTKNKR